MKFVFVILVGCIIIGVVHSKSVQFDGKVDDLFPLTIIHINDFHARFEETNINSNTCKVNETCIGGYARVVTMVKQLQATTLNPIYLNAGDNFQGTLWYNLLRHNVTSHFLNMLPADAITIGNHEFDHKIEGVVPFITALTSPVIISNIDDTNEPTFQGLYSKSTVIDKYDRKIGIIGVMLSTTNQIASTEKLKFLDESKSVATEAEKLHNQGIDIIIVLSHCGLDVDFVIAKNGGPYIDVIVGGHSHTFMYNGTNLPGLDIPGGHYPEQVYQENGHKVLIVQAAAFTKYVGNLTVWFDEKGEVVTAEGAPIYLDESVTPDPVIINDLLPYKAIIDVESNKVVGYSFVDLDTADCNTGDCNIGNFIADAIVFSFMNEQDEDGWAKVNIAFTNVGGIRTTLPKGTLTFGDLKTALPFDNTIDMFELRGDYLLNALEYSVTKSYDKDRFVGANLLQSAGLRVVANVTNPIGERILSVDVLCRKCRVPEYEPLKKEEIYRVATPSFLTGGGDGFTMISKNRENLIIGGIDIEALETYVRKRSPVMAPIDGRLKILT